MPAFHADNFCATCGEYLGSVTYEAEVPRRARRLYCAVHAPQGEPHRPFADVWAEIKAEDAVPPEEERAAMSGDRRRRAAKANGG